MADPGAIRGPIIIPNCIQVRLALSQPNGKTVFNVMHGRVAAGFTPTGTIAEAIWTALKAATATTAWRTHLSSAVSLVSIDLKDLRTLGPGGVSNPIIPSTSAAVAGTAVGGFPLPPGDAFVVTLRTLQAGRSARGRVYLGGLNNDQLAAAGAAAAAVVTDAPAFVTAIQTALTGQAITLCLGLPARAGYTSAKGTVHPARVATTLDVSSIIARNNLIDKQRRRAGRT